MGNRLRDGNQHAGSLLERALGINVPGEREGNYWKMLPSAVVSAKASAHSGEL